MKCILQQKGAGDIMKPRMCHVGRLPMLRRCGSVISLVARLTVPIAVVACASRAEIQRAPYLDDPDELRVIAAVVDQVVHARSNGAALVHDSTSAVTASGTLPENIRTRVVNRLNVSEAVIAAFVRANRVRVHLHVVPTELRPTQLVPDSVVLNAVLRIEESGGGPVEHWEWFTQRFPGVAGRTRVSRPGIAGDQALIQIAHSCGSRCGHQSYVALARQGDAWKVTGSFATILF